MLDYPTLKIIWWLLIGVLLVGFAVMDGHDMGVATLLPLCRPTTWSAGSSSTPWARTGTAIRCRSLPAGARSSRRGRWSMPRPFPGSTGRCSWCSGRCFCGRSASTTAARSSIPPGAPVGTGACSSAAPCRRWYSGWPSATCAGRAVRFRRTHAVHLHGQLLAAVQPVRAGVWAGEQRHDHFPRRRVPGAPHRGHDPAPCELRCVAGGRRVPGLVLAGGPVGRVH